MDKKAIFNALFKIKKHRSNGYDVDDIPKWDEKLEELLVDLNVQRNTLNFMKAFFETSKTSKDIFILEDIVYMFKQIAKLNYPVFIESIVAHQALTVVYGIKVCGNVLRYIESDKDAGKFYAVYSILWDITKRMDDALGNSKEGKIYWHTYAFKIGANWLDLALKIKETGTPFFTLDEDYGIELKNHTVYRANPLSLILPSMLEYKFNSYHVGNSLRMDVRTIIEKGMKSN